MTYEELFHQDNNKAGLQQKKLWILKWPSQRPNLILNQYMWGNWRKLCTENALTNCQIWNARQNGWTLYEIEKLLPQTISLRICIFMQPHYCNFFFFPLQTLKCWHGILTEVGRLFNLCRLRDTVESLK